ncbi:MAG: sigma-70 family RNA polymerase sigma factor [Planctomycetales bacterium]|nr:sigma-70 family RNA polymerase sigma factor [Planctomycetales bacterium]
MTQPENQQGTVTRLLGQSADGDAAAKEALFQMIYDDLRRAASRVLQKTQQHDFQTTDLVHQSMLRFQDPNVLNRYSANRKVFFSVAVKAMQQVMIDHYRKRKNSPPSAPHSQILDVAIETTEKRFDTSFDLLTQALQWLADAAPRQHACLTHRFFGGLTSQQTADLLEISLGTVERDCRLGRARLLLYIKEHLDG